MTGGASQVTCSQASSTLHARRRAARAGCARRRATPVCDRPPQKRRAIAARDEAARPNSTTPATRATNGQMEGSADERPIPAQMLTCSRPASKCSRARQGWYACSQARERGTGSHCDYGNQASSKHRGKVRENTTTNTRSSVSLSALIMAQLRSKLPHAHPKA